MDKLSDPDFKAITSSLLETTRQLEEITKRIPLCDLYDPDAKNSLVDLLRLCLPAIKRTMSEVEKESERRNPVFVPGTFKDENGCQYVYDIYGRWRQVFVALSYNGAGKPGVPCRTRFNDDKDCDAIRSIDGTWYKIHPATLS